MEEKELALHFPFGKVLKKKAKDKLISDIMANFKRYGNIDVKINDKRKNEVIEIVKKYSE